MGPGGGCSWGSCLLRQLSRNDGAKQTNAGVPVGGSYLVESPSLLVVGHHLAAFAEGIEGDLGRSRRSVWEAVAQINTYLRDVQ